MALLVVERLRSTLVALNASGASMARSIRTIILGTHSIFDSETPP